MAAKKRKATKKQLANLAKGRAKLARIRKYGVTKEFPRGHVQGGHAALRRTCKHCARPHTTSQHNSHAVYGHGKTVDKVVPAYALTHKIKKHPLKGVMKGY